MIKDCLYKSFLRNYYLTSFFYNFVFAYAIYNLFFSVNGLSVFQISILLAWWSFVAVILEIPTGALADSWNRKKMLVIAPLAKIICFIIWFIANGNFYLYALGFVFWSIGSSFVSGTSEALLYDFLSRHDRKGDYEIILGRNKFYFNIALAISMAVGGIIANYNIPLTILVSVIPLFLSFLFALKLEEIPKVGSTDEVHYLDHICVAFKEIKSNRVLLMLFVYLISISVFGNLEEYDQLYYQFVNLPLYAFGAVGFMWSFFNAIASYFAHKFKTIYNIYILGPLIGTLCLFLVATFPSIPMIVLLLVSYFFATPVRVLVESKVQHSISGSSRATITSAGNLFINFFSIVQVIVAGLISRIWNLPAIYFSAAVFLLIFSFWVYSTRKHGYLDSQV